MELATLQRAKALEVQYEALGRDKRKWEEDFYEPSSRKRESEFLFPGDVPHDILEAFRLAVIADINQKITTIITEFSGL